jgi:hypothetical protein
MQAGFRELGAEAQSLPNLLVTEVLTADGSKVMVSTSAVGGQGYADGVTEYSTRTGQALADVAPPVTSGFPGTFCVSLWSNPSGERVITSCGHPELYDRGRVSPITLHIPMNGTDILWFAW